LASDREADSSRLEAGARNDNSQTSAELTSIVAATDLECLLGELKRSASSDSAGLFKPDSVSWKVNREAGLFLAAGYATLLQLAHPWVAAAIAEHSKTFHDPIGRFHQTFRVMFTMSFGPVDQAITTARHMHRRHQSIHGTMRETVGAFAKSSQYEANEVRALQWVYATLIDTSVMAYDFILPALTPEEREQYYMESRASATFFGIPRDAWPRDWRQFEEYKESMFASDRLAVSPAARHIAAQVLTGAGSWLRIPSWYRVLTAHLLPSRLRDEFGLAYSERERCSAELILSRIRRVYRHLPESLRFVGPYREALAKLNGRSRPSLSVRLSNKLWVGQTTLFAPAEHM
jgi:uncharacterized protein (DUF2236 family)